MLADAEAIATQVPSVKYVAPQINTQELITYRNKNSNSTITGTTPDFLSVRSFDVARGRFVTDLDVKRNNQVIVLGPELANKLFGNIDPIGKSVRVKNVSFQVIGVMEPKGAFLGTNQDDTAIVPLTTLGNRVVGRRRSPYGVQLSFISISAKDDASMGAAQFQIENLLRLRHKITRYDDFTVNNQKDLLQTVNTVTNGLTLMLAAIAAISLFVGGIGIMNIMLVSVTERTQEIGLRKAVGATQRDILIQFMIEAVILSASGGLIGTAIGVGGILVVGVFSPLQAAVSPIAIAIAVGVSGGIGLFFGVIPAQRAAQLDPIVALRSA